ARRSSLRGCRPPRGRHRADPVCRPIASTEHAWHEGTADALFDDLRSDGDNIRAMTDTAGPQPEASSRAELSASIREERKTVTAVFADVVGSTALAERSDPEEFRLIVGEAIVRMVHAVESFGGTVKDIAGDGVLALF